MSQSQVERDFGRGGTLLCAIVDCQFARGDVITTMCHFVRGDTCHPEMPP